MMERQGRRAVSTVEDLVEGPEFRAFPEAAGEANVWRTICLILLCKRRGRGEAPQRRVR